MAWAAASAISPVKAQSQQAEAHLSRSDAGGWKAIGREEHPMKHMPLSIAIDPEELRSPRAGVLRGKVWRFPDWAETRQKMRFRFRGI